MASPLALAATPVMSGDSSLTARVLTAMLDVLDNYLPPNPAAPPPLPDPSLSLVSMIERAVGIGSRIGTDTRGPFTVSAVKGTRIEAVVRYQLWSDKPEGVDHAVQDLVTRLLADREVLRAAGFLHLALRSTGASENVAALSAWREIVDFEVLYEFSYADADDAESLIAQIPVKSNDQFAASMIISDEMTRWDNTSAPALLLRGAASIGRLSALSFTPVPALTGKVTLTRTFDGAAGLPITLPNLESFLAVVAGASPSQRHAEVVFTSLEKFLAAITSFKVTARSLDELATEVVPPTPAVLANLRGIIDQEFGGTDEFLAKLETTIGVAETGIFKSVILKHTTTSTPVSMGDWDKNGVADIYESPARRIDPAIKLPTVADRLEITYDLTPSTTVFAVVYLRATPD